MIPIALRFVSDDDTQAHVVDVDADRQAYAARDKNGNVLIGLRSKGLKETTLTMTGEAAEALWFALTDALEMGTL